MTGEQVNKVVALVCADRGLKPPGGALLSADEIRLNSDEGLQHLLAERIDEYEAKLRELEFR